MRCWHLCWHLFHRVCRGFLRAIGPRKESFALKLQSTVEADQLKHPLMKISVAFTHL
jgi:hypothetical protein